MIDFGDIFIQTAGEKQRFVFQNIPHPNQVAKLILELAEENRKEQLEQAVEDFNMPDGTSTDSKSQIAKKIEP
jgi:hypothetical protein